MLMRFPLLGLALLASACGDTKAPEAPEAKPAPEARPTPEPLAPQESAEPGGLADDDTPVSEEPFSQTSAEGAAQVLQTYYALIEAGRYDEAWELRWRGRGDDAQSREAFAASFDRYAEYHANVGAPGRIGGAAGSLYVEVPVQIYGRTKDGEAFSSAGTVTLRRVNDVPGSTEAERRWRIYSRD